MAEKITIEFGGERIDIPEFAMDSSVKSLQLALKQQGIKSSKIATDTKKAIENLVKELVGVNARLHQKTQLATEKLTLQAVKDVGKQIAVTNKSTLSVSTNLISSYKGTIAALTKIREAITSQQMSPEVVVKQDGVAPKQDDSRRKSIETLLQEFVGEQGIGQQGVAPKQDDSQTKAIENLVNKITGQQGVAPKQADGTETKKAVEKLIQEFVGKQNAGQQGVAPKQENKQDSDKSLETPEFAMDSTVKNLIRVTSAIGVRATTDAKDSRKELQKIVDSILGANAKQQSKKEVDAQDKTTDAVKNVKKAIQTSSKAQKGLLGKLGGGSGSILGGVVSKFGKFGKMLNPVTAGLFGLFTAVKNVTAFLMKMGRLENSLFRQGFNFVDPSGKLANGIAVLGAQATDASLSIDEFVELTSQFATAFGEFGTKTITDAVSNTQDLLKSQGFLGLSNNEMAQAVGEMSEQFLKLGLNIEGQSQFLANQTVKVLQTTQAFTKLTNTSNDVIRQMVMQATSMEAFRNALQMLPSQLRAGAMESSQVAFAGLAALGDDLGGQLTTALSEGIGRGGLQFTEFGQQLAGVSPILLDSLQGLAHAASNDGDVVGALDHFRSSIGEVDANQRQFLRALEISGDPMAKFVIKLANMNETIDDNSFKQLMSTMSEVKADQLGVAQTQLALAMARVRTAFQKLQIAFLTPETVRAFEWGVMQVVKMLEGFAEFMKKDLFGIVNSFISSIAKGITFLKNLFSGGANGMAEMSTKLTGAATNAIGAVLNRALAALIPGGDSKNELAKMDRLKLEVKGSKTQEDYDANLKKLYDYVFNTTTIFGNELKLRDKGFADNNFKKEQMLNKRLGKYGVDFKGFQYEDKILKEKNANNKKDFQDHMDGVTDDTNMMGAKAKSNIKIMPMYGDLDAYAENQSPTVKNLIEINKTLTAQLEESRAHSALANKGLNYTKEQRDALRAMQTDGAYQIP